MKALVFLLALIPGMAAAQQFLAAPGGPAVDPSTRFEAAAIRQVAACAPAAADASTGGRGGGAGTPGRLHLCGTLAELIELAFADVARGPRTDPGGLPELPASVTRHLHDRFEVTARAAPGTTMRAMTGPMLRTFLAERFGIAA